MFMDQNGNRTVEPRAGNRPPEMTKSNPNIASHVVVFFFLPSCFSFKDSDAGSAVKRDHINPGDQNNTLVSSGFV